MNIWKITNELITLMNDHNVILYKIKHPIPKKTPHFYKFSRKVNIIMSRLKMNIETLNIKNIKMNINQLVQWKKCVFSLI